MQRHQARKRFGQNFLHDPSVIERLLEHIDPQPGDALVEVGPGLGALTLPLLELAGTLSVIEIDRDLVARLRARELAGLEIIEGDVLNVDFARLLPGKALRLVGNLPYNIGTPLLLAWLPLHARIKDIHVMLQQEVVARLAAGPGSRARGRLGVMMQSVFEIEPLFRVPPGAFRPPPKVDSAIVRLRPRREVPAATVIDALESITRLAFAARRKTLRNNFRGVFDDATLEALGIDPGARAETLDNAAFLALADRFTA